MSAFAYHVAIISAAGRIERTTLAHNGMRAIQIALDTVTEADISGQFAIICKPEHLPCAIAEQEAA